MPKTSLNRSILKLAVPNIISNITVPLLGFVDMVLMGHQDSIAYIGAIGLGGTIFSVMYSIFSFMRAGTTGFTAQAYGANDRAEIAYSLYRSLCIALIATVLVLSLQNAVEWLSMKLLHGSEEVLAYTATYFHVRIWAAPAVLCLYAFNGWFIGMQNTTIPMVIAILTNVVNIVLSVVFVNYMGMGVSGVALGTVIAQYCGLITAIVFLFAKFRHHLIPIRSVLLLEKDKLKRFFQVNADFMIRSILLVLSIAYFNNQSAKLGDDMLAVNMILMQFFYIRQVAVPLGFPHRLAVHGALCPLSELVHRPRQRPTRNPPYGQTLSYLSRCHSAHYLCGFSLGRHLHRCHGSTRHPQYDAHFGHRRVFARHLIINAALWQSRALGCVLAVHGSTRAFHDLDGEKGSVCMN